MEENVYLYSYYPTTQTRAHIRKRERAYTHTHTHRLKYKRWGIYTKEENQPHEDNNKRKWNHVNEQAANRSSETFYSF